MGFQESKKSSFLGDLNNNRREELRLRLKKILGSKTGNIQIFPICDKDFKLRKTIINDEVQTNGVH